MKRDRNSENKFGRIDIGPLPYSLKKKKLIYHSVIIHTTKSVYQSVTTVKKAQSSIIHMVNLLNEKTVKIDFEGKNDLNAFALLGISEIQLKGPF